MSSFGHVRDMMERYAANRELLRAKRKRHFRKSNTHTGRIHQDRPSNYQEIDHAEWEKVKNRIRKDKRRELRLWIIASIVVGISLLLLIRWLF
jgi:hypothetical protein